MIRFAKAQDIKVGVFCVEGGERGRRELGRIGEAGMIPRAMVCSVDERPLLTPGDTHSIEIYRDLSSLLDKSDTNLVVVTAPTNIHAEIGMQCLQADRSVIIYPPMALRVRECKDLIAQAFRTSRLLSVAHCRHWDGCVTRAKEIVDGGKIGSVIRVEIFFDQPHISKEAWQHKKSQSGGILYSGIHLLEYALQFVDSEIEEVSGFSTLGLTTQESSESQDNIEDIASVIVRFANGARIDMSVSSIDAHLSLHREHEVVVYGTLGVYSFNSSNWELVRSNERGEVVTEKGENLPDQPGEFYKNIVAHLVEEEELIINPEWAFRNIQILDIASKSVLLNRVISILPE